MTDLFAILIAVSSISVLAFAVGYFNTRFYIASKKVKKLEKDRARILGPLMSSSDLASVSRKLIKLREKARRMRDS